MLEPATVADVRRLCLSLPRTTEHLIRDRVKFRVKQLVYVSFSRDETLMGFAFPKDERDALIASDPLALLVGFALDQQVPVHKAFMGPLVLRERLGAFDANTLASADLEPVFRERPAIHRFPGSMARRVHALAVQIRDRYDGDASRVWADSSDASELRANLAALPGFGEMKIKSLGAVLAKRFGVAAAQELVPSHPTLGDVDSADALADYQAAKRAHKAERRAAQVAAS